jgi:digeranylgeranylglycerophospholipid reductase
MVENSDVVVIGAGPAGSTTAKEIAKHGFNVFLVEKDEYPGENNICGGGIKPSIAEKVNNQVLEKKILGYKHYFPWGVLESGNEKYQAATVRRRIFDRFLAEDAEKKGAKLLAATQAKEVIKKKDKMVVSLENKKNKKTASIETKLVVFSDGVNTLAYRKFGFGFKPDFDKTFAGMICEIEWKDNPWNEYEFYYGADVSPWGYGWIFPKKDVLNVGVGCLYCKLKKKVNEYLNYLIKDHPLVSKKISGKKILRIGSALIPFAPADKIYSESMLAVGDAAGMVDPIDGGGIYHGITGGLIAGDTAVQALKNSDFSSEFLSSYQHEWERTSNYRDIYRKYTLSNIFLFLSKFDKNAYSKLVALTQNQKGFSGVVSKLKTLSR